MNDTTPLPNDASREHLMVQVARMTYQQDKSQTEIALETGLNRWQVARLLADARDTGVVRIEIVPRNHRLPDLESRLLRAFGLRDAVVVPTDAGGDAVALVAGAYLAGLRPRPDVVGVSWGRTMAEVAHWLPEGWAQGVTVVQINGTVAPKPQARGHNDVAETFAVKGNGRFVPLPVPAIVGARETRDILMRDRIVSDVINIAKGAKLLCFSFGALGEDSALVHSGNLLASEVEALLKAGAVGDILGHIIDAEGRIIAPDIDARTIGLDLGTLAQAERSVGVAYGAQKHAVTRAALRAGLVNTLVTDEDTAIFALEQTT
ncbi:Deoxyribonucleoside regulator [Aquimixticola soesokkakensis]|uniref:Deoxyribonucleoside regulator n=1 Tax=Aquimixticola soesokkakensis TaxID=1519096 RepID=A0A1Y5SCM8_9RHOB|nr:sugar-binding transcriptional regulator [Aquimixticola soesokkakensis]SLN37683.1 Deoxyribonucleoside regulator [Aquimixticola soesokkakensis]